MIGPWLDLGFFNWYSTSKPLNSYADLKGLKIRNSGGAGQAWRTQFMGAIPNTTPCRTCRWDCRRARSTA